MNHLKEWTSYHINDYYRITILHFILTASGHIRGKNWRYLKPSVSFQQNIFNFSWYKFTLFSYTFYVMIIVFNLLLPKCTIYLVHQQYLRNIFWSPHLNLSNQERVPRFEPTSFRPWSNCSVPLWCSQNLAGPPVT